MKVRRSASEAQECGSWLLLVLALSGGVEVIQDALHVVEGGSVFGFIFPAGVHDVVQFGGTVFRPGHAVATLHRGHDLAVAHS